MPRYVVVLEIRLRGSAAGSTRDVIEATNEAEAVAVALREWRRLRPDRTFGVLLSAPALPGEVLTLDSR